MSAEADSQSNRVATKYLLLMHIHKDMVVGLPRLGCLHIDATEVHRIYNSNDVIHDVFVLFTFAKVAVI